MTESESRNNAKLLLFPTPDSSAESSPGGLNLYLNGYLFFSAATSVFLWFAAYFSSPRPFHHNFYLTCLAVGTLYFYLFAGKERHYIRATLNYPALFVFQLVCLIGMSFSYSSQAPLYLTYFPWLTGTFFFLYREGPLKRGNWTKASFLFLIGLGVYGAFHGITRHALLKPIEVSVFGAFALWGGGFAYTLARVFSFKRNKYISPKSNKRRSWRDEIKGQSGLSDQEDRYFFHDLINQTHGIHLFLQQRVGLNKGFSTDEANALAKEIKLIQSLIKDHFGYGHRNLVNTYELVPFEFAKKGLYQLTRSFLPEHLVDCHFVFKGKISEQADLKDMESSIIHYPTFIRIMTNLIKNMADAQTPEVEMIFNYSEKGLEITTRNKLFKLNSKTSNLEKRLSHIILEVEDFHKLDYSGLGLSSASTLCERIGGEFKFSIEDGYWINQVFLPAVHFNSSSQDEAA